MSQPQQVNVTVQKKGGCTSGCGTVILIFLAIGFLVTYWYVGIALAVVAIAFVIWAVTRDPPAVPPAQEPPQLGRRVEVRCAACGEQVAPTASQCPKCGNHL